jgi:uncharacterized phiE125 gp8 family phage protein
MLTIVTPPGHDPLYVEDVKRHLRVTHGDEDFLIQDLIAAVASWLSGRDGWLGRSLITQTLELTLPLPFRKGFVGPHWSGAGCIVLPRPPYIEFEGVSVLDRDGVTWWLSAEEQYFIRIDGDQLARVSFSAGEFWPAAAPDPVSVTVRYKSGYGPTYAYVDAGIRQAMFMTIARLYANRGDGLNADFREDRFVQSLFAPYRIWM